MNQNFLASPQSLMLPGQGYFALNLKSVTLNPSCSNSKTLLKNNGSANDQSVNLLKMLLILAKMQENKKSCFFSITTNNKVKVMRQTVSTGN